MHKIAYAWIKMGKNHNNKCEKIKKSVSISTDTAINCVWYTDATVYHI
jgi:hypothetical protein